MIASKLSEIRKKQQIDSSHTGVQINGPSFGKTYSIQIVDIDSDAMSVLLNYDPEKLYIVPYSSISVIFMGETTALKPSIITTR